MDFGIPNAGADSLTDDKVQGKVAELLRGRSTLVMLVTEETEGLLPPTHFPQIRTNVIRRAIRADAGMVLRHTTPPVGGIRFDVY